MKKKWADLHRTNAKLVHKHILKYRGFLTKVGQAASTRAGDLPQPWVEELESLQDELPVSSFAEVCQTVKKDLGRPLDQVFQNFSQKPVASASVAQAHVAWLKSTGKKVCVKVQHKGVAAMMGTDLATVEFICSRAAKYHPEAPDTTEIVKEWKRASREEVDFRLEAKNQLRALRALRRSGINVTCPEPIIECCTKRVLTMNFINGWKITDVDRLPFGTDRSKLSSDLVEAFAMLAFQEGLIHGDPHPGNVFVEPLEDGSDSVRACLLDWGIVKSMERNERTAAARWVVATLAQDRILYFNSMKELGFTFDVDPDSAEFMNFLEASMGSSVWLFRDAVPSSAQQQFLNQMRKHQDRMEGKDVAALTGGKKTGKLISKVPGVVLFLMRGLGMLQNICGTLEASVAFAAILLRYVMPLLAMEHRSGGPSQALPARSDCSELEMAVRKQLQELDQRGFLLGAQVAVLETSGEELKWLCRASCGRCASWGGGPINDGLLMPLMGASCGPLLFCVLASLSMSVTATGKKVDLDTPLGQLWPEFGQKGKGSVTVGQLLLHEGGLGKPFPWNMTIKAFCSELRMEEVLAVSPTCSEGDGPCPLQGAVLAALLRRLTGHRTAAESLRSILQKLSLQDQIAYKGAPSLLAFAGHRPQETLSMAHIFKWLEEKVDSLDQQLKDKSSWLGGKEFASAKPWITDPLIVNRDVLRKGDSCLPGYSLRANAESLCQLFASDLISDEFLHLSKESGRTVKLQDDILVELSAVGWHLLKFRKIGKPGSEVMAFGYVDPASGSLMIRLPKAAIAILLTCVDKEARGAAYALLGAAVQPLGLEPAWSDSSLPQKTPEKSPSSRGRKTPCHKALEPDAQDDDTMSKASSAVARLAEVMATTKVVESPQARGSSAMEEGATPQGIAGTWHSTETVGLEELLEGLQAPPMVQTMAAAARRTLIVKINGDEVTLSTSTRVMGKTIEDTTTTFNVAEPFTGEQTIGGKFRGLASWLKEDSAPSRSHPGLRSDDEDLDHSGGEDPSDCEEEDEDEDDEDSGARKNLGVVKRFTLDGKEVVMEEHLRLLPDDRLALTTSLRACHLEGEQAIELSTHEDLTRICNNLDPVRLKLRRELQLSGGRKFAPGARLVTLADVSKARQPRGVTVPASLDELKTIRTPAAVILKYEALKSTTFFEREGGGKRLLPSSMKGVAAAATAARSRAEALLGSFAPASVAFGGLPKTPLGCMAGAAAGAAALGVGAAALLGMGLLALGRVSGSVCAGCMEKGGTPICFTGPTAHARSSSTSKLKAVKASTAADNEFAVQLVRRQGDRLGVEVECCEDPSALCILDVREGLMQSWNRDHPEQQVRPGDLMVELNGVRGSAEELMAACRSAGESFNLRFRHAGSKAPTTAKSPTSTPRKGVPRSPETTPKAKQRPDCQQAKAVKAALDAESTRPPPPTRPAPRPEAMGWPPARHGKDSRPTAILFQDPRARWASRSVGIIAFGHPSRSEACQQCCGGDFLLLSQDLSPAGLKLEAPCERGRSKVFLNAEAAFQATMFWPLASQFQSLTSVAALQKVRRFGGNEDQTYAGFGSSWAAIRAVLQAKFPPHSPLAMALLKTGDAFLLECGGPTAGRGPPWTSGGWHDANWLGLALMVLRDSLSGRRSWLDFLSSVFDLEHGQPRDAVQLEQWLQACRRARAALEDHLRELR